MKGDLRCVDGRLMRHDPQSDDPYLETDRGECPDCAGEGCEAIRRHAETHCECCGEKVTSYPNGCPLCSAPQCCQRCCRDEYEGRKVVEKYGLPDGLVP